MAVERPATWRMEGLVLQAAQKFDRGGEFGESSDRAQTGPIGTCPIPASSPPATITQERIVVRGWCTRVHSCMCGSGHASVLELLKVWEGLGAPLRWAGR